MSAAAGVPSRAEVLTMFRSFLRVVRKFTDYNIREYTKRRAVDAFHGKAQLEVAKRQAVIYSLYAPKLKSVMEVQNPIKHRN
ncbi:LYR motif-containing protein 4 [Pyrus ussuriensis x Pyrus communis]|uniref:LYR motif-containing protein 4 n=1 Tax=Pyrus ussuriensis x Pyrus communis TaxID=2448454 RepID=A0A5N5GA98_9ROSA|nr:LYR motif-containing protein 4 [Pyrus ussuriensis x Pyrus communis]